MVGLQLFSVAWTAAFPQLSPGDHFV